LEVQSLSVIDVDTTKKLAIVLVVIGSMPMVICNRFHERLANNDKITTFTGVPLFNLMPSSLNLENQDLHHQNLRSMLKILFAAFYAYFKWFRRNSPLKCVSQPNITQKSMKKTSF